MKKRYFVASLLIFSLFFSCAGLLSNILNDIKEMATTAVARYIQNEVGGITIKDFEGQVLPSNMGLNKPSGEVVKSFNFSAPKDDGVMSCEEVPIDFVKISKRTGERAVTTGKSNKYVGTWEGFIPLGEGFKRVFLDLKKDETCGIYLELPQTARKLVDIKTRVVTVIEGSCTKGQNAYELFATIDNAKGYATLFKHMVTTLKIVGDELLAEFKVDGRDNSVAIFKLDSDRSQGDKKVYVGTRHFEKYKLEKEITLEINENTNNCTFTIPEGTKLPRNYYQ